MCPRPFALSFLLILLGITLNSPSVKAQFTDVASSAGVNLSIPTEAIPGPVLAGQHLIDEHGTGEATCAVDLNQDGHTDVIIARRNLPCLVFINQGDGTFTEQAAALGLDTVSDVGGIAAGDLSNRGVPDLFMTPITGDRYYLFINDGTGHFTEQAVARNAAVSATNHRKNGQSAALVDYDLDGFLDIHVTEWGINPILDNPNHSVLLRNRGLIQPGFFDNVTEFARLTQPKVGPRMYGMSSAWADFDADGYPDLMLVGDISTSQLWWNNGDGTFTERTLASGLQRNDDMGVGIADVNGDGRLDIFITAISVGGLPPNDFTSTNHLYLNQGNRTFIESSLPWGVRFTGWGWGTAFLDIENDGDPDLLSTNGIIDGPQFLSAHDDTSVLLRHNGSSYEDVSAAFGITDNRIGRSVMIFDYNNDGREDALITNVVGARSLYRNDTPTGANAWLRLRFTGTASNRDGYGALVTAVVGPKTYTSLYQPTNAYIGQREPLLHLGLGPVTSVDSLTIRWPSGFVQTLTNVPANQILSVTEPLGVVAAPVITADPVSTSAAKGSTITLSATATGMPAPVFVWYKDGVRIDGANASSYTIKRLHPFDAAAYTVAAINRAGTATSAPATVSVTLDASAETVARWWNEALLDAIRKDVPNPPVHARNLYTLSAAFWDSFWAYEDGAWNYVAPMFHREIVPAAAWLPNREAAQREALSYAAYRILTERFKNSVGKVRTQVGNRWLMQQLGYDPDFTGTTGTSPAAVGNRIGYAILAAMLNDGANEAHNYADATGYASVNPNLRPVLPGTTITDPNHWQRLDLAFVITQNGIILPPAPQPFIGVNARNTTPFSIVKPTPTTLPPFFDPGAPPRFGAASPTHQRFVDEAVDVIRYSSFLDPNDGVMINISPGAILNNPVGTNDGTGHPVNPVTDLPYAPNVVPRADYYRILSEYWADGPSSETPPGHWNVIFNQINDDSLLQRRIGGTGAELSPLEWEVRGYMALNGAVHDAACAAWGIKRIYDGPRPISIIRYLGGLGQSTNTTHRTYNPLGLPLIPGLIEIITPASSRPGQRHAHLAAFAGNEIAIRTWQGNPEDPVNAIGGVGWIRAKMWTPFQLETFVSPAFPGYISGHSTFSSSAAEVLTRYTGSAYYPGGLSSKTFEANKFLIFEKGPSQTVTLEWATYYDAADQAGLSRLSGGIHVAADDFEGRKLGRHIGTSAYAKVQGMLATPVAGLGLWRQINFGTDRAEGPAANDATPYDDGVPNLLKYAFGVGAPEDARALLPTVDTVGTAELTLRLSFRRYTSRTDLVYRVEASSDLNDWQEIASSTVGAPTENILARSLNIVETPAENGLVHVAVTDALPLSSDAGARRFLRLRVDPL